MPFYILWKEGYLMIFYFSGTGNSEFVAEQIQLKTRDEMYMINSLLDVKETRTFHSERPFVFVCPTYAWRIPRVVQKFIYQHIFTGNLEVYFILTCGDETKGASLHIEKLCKEKNFVLLGFAEIVMPENYLALFKTPDEKESKEIIKKALPTISDIANKISKEEALDKFISKDTFYSRFINPLFYKFIVKDKKFFASDTCISCGACEDICPMDNIELVDEKPKWFGNCTHCMACIAYCPTRSIEYGKETKNQIRYTFPFSDFR